MMAAFFFFGRPYFTLHALLFESVFFFQFDRRDAPVLYPARRPGNNSCRDAINLLNGKVRCVSYFIFIFFIRSLLAGGQRGNHCGHLRRSLFFFTLIIVFIFLYF